MSSLRKSSNSSGKCIYCNTFICRLASHMLLSESCMLASQESLSHKGLPCKDYCDNLLNHNDSAYDDIESSQKKSFIFQTWFEWQHTTFGFKESENIWMQCYM